MVLSYWLNYNQYGLSPSPVRVAKFLLERQKKTISRGLNDCMMLGDYRQSVLVKNGRTLRSQNVKREAIRTVIISRHFAPPILPSIGSKRASRWMGNHLWPMYRPIVLSIYIPHLYVRVWAKNMTSRRRNQSRELPVTWLNIYSKIQYSAPPGLKDGIVSVTLNPFLNPQEKRQMLSYYSHEMIGKDWRELQLWLKQETLMYPKRRP